MTMLGYALGVLLAVPVIVVAEAIGEMWSAFWGNRMVDQMIADTRKALEAGWPQT